MTTTDTKALSRAEVDEAFAELRREVITGDESAIVDYVTELATIAANAHRTSGTFRRWSHRNHLLLTAQRRRLGETHVGLYAGRTQWARLDRSVRSDATPKRIWAASGSKKSADGKAQVPILGTAAAAAAANAVAEKVADTDEEPAPTKWTSKFRIVEVFDWSDTVANDPDVGEPDWSAPVVGTAAETLDALVASAPLEVSFAEFGGAVAHGSITDTEIVVDTALPSTLRAFEVARQWAHLELGTPTDFADCVNDPAASEDRIEREQTATLVAVLVSTMLGVDAGDSTRTAANWLRTLNDPETGEAITGHKRRLKAFNARVDASMDAANRIISAARGA